MQMQVWADKLATAEDSDDLFAIIRDLYQQEDIPYGGRPASQEAQALVPRASTIALLAKMRYLQMPICITNPYLTRNLHQRNHA
jgi:hypothetical protein